MSEKYICPECGEEFETADDLARHLEEEHAYSEEEARAVAEGRQLEREEETERSEERRIPLRPRRHKISLDLNIPKSSDILREILERYEIKESKVDDIIAEIEDLEEGKQPGEFLSPQEVASVLQAFGVKQPKLGFIVNKYTQKVYKILMDIQYRQAAFVHGGFGMPGVSNPMYPAMPGFGTSNPFSFPMSSSAMRNQMVMQQMMMNPYNPMSYLVQMQMWKQVQRMLEMWEEEEELRLKKLRKELEIAEKGGGSSSKKSSEDDKIEKLRKEFEEKLEKHRQEVERLRDELHKKDLEVVKKDFELQLEKNKSPDFFQTLQFVDYAARMLGYQKGPTTGLAVVQQQLDKIDKRVGDVIDIFREAIMLQRAKKIKSAQERRTRSEEDRRKLIETLDKKLSELEEKKKAREEFLRAAEKISESQSQEQEQTGEIIVSG